MFYRSHIRPQPKNTIYFVRTKNCLKEKKKTDFTGTL